MVCAQGAQWAGACCVWGCWLGTEWEGVCVSSVHLWWYSGRMRNWNPRSATAIMSSGIRDVPRQSLSIYKSFPHLTCTTSWHRKKASLTSLFCCAGKEDKAQRCSDTCPRSHSRWSRARILTLVPAFLLLSGLALHCSFLTCSVCTLHLGQPAGPTCTLGNWLLCLCVSLFVHRINTEVYQLSVMEINKDDGCRGPGWFGLLRLTEPGSDHCAWFPLDNGRVRNPVLAISGLPALQDTVLLGTCVSSKDNMVWWHT